MRREHPTSRIRHLHPRWALFAAALVATTSCSGEDDAFEIHEPSDLIRAERFGALVFELDSVRGAEPHPGVTTRIQTQAALLMNKPDGISIVRDDTLEPSQPGRAWTAEELHALAKETESLVPAPGQARVHVLAVDGHLDSDTEGLFTLGLSWGRHTIVLFSETIQGGCGTSMVKTWTIQELCDQTETVVWLHELGHLLGLVNNGTPMGEDHEDSEHRARPESRVHHALAAARPGRAGEATQPFRRW